LEEKMKIFMTGGTGFVGRKLAGKLGQEGNAVTVVTRGASKKASLAEGISYIQADPTRPGKWQEKIAEHDVVINLAGSSIFRRWSKAAREEIRQSRIATTENLVQALEARKGKETSFLSTSAVGYYGFQGDRAVDESDSPGQGFLADVCKEWESKALGAASHGARVAICRFGVVLGRGGGALQKLVSVFRWHLGTQLGSGEQWLSWIHEEDLVQIYLYVLKHREITGALNCTSPRPVKNRELTKILGEVLGRGTFLPPAPGFIVRLVLGEFGDLFLKGQKALPAKLLQSGFTFKFPDLREALQNLLS